MRGARAALAALLLLAEAASALAACGHLAYDSVVAADAGDDGDGAPPASSCDAWYGDAPGYLLCDETAGTCSFNAVVDYGTCQEVCADRGGECRSATNNFNDRGQECVDRGWGDDDCLTDRRRTAICECSKP